MPQVERRNRLLVLTHFYEPEPNFITADVAARLSRDYDVTVVAPHPNYPLNTVYPGTRSRWRPVRSRERGVTVWRLPILPYHGLSHFRRALCYLSFALPALVFAPLVAGRASVVWVYLGPFSTALAGIPFKLFGRARLVYTCADLWPESLLAAGVAKPGWMVRALFGYSRAINRVADRIICSTRGTLERFAQDGISRERLDVLPVWVRGLDELPSAAPARLRAGSARSIVYAGNMGPAQKLDTVIRAARELQQDGIPVTFDLYGSGSDEGRLRLLAEEAGLTNVRFHGRVSPATAFEVSSAALAQIICLAPSPLFAMTVPSKLSFCCAAGAPLLAGLAGEAAEIAASSGGALPFDPRDPPSLARAVERLLAMSADERAAMSASLQRYYHEHYEVSTLLERCTAIIAGAERQPASAPAAVPAPD